MKYAESFFEVANMFGRIHGTPLPSELLVYGDKDNGWCATLNPTPLPLSRNGDGAIPPYSAMLCFGGLPMGVIDPGGGTLLVIDDRDVEAELIEWARGERVE